MNDTKQFTHGSEGTHSSCNARVKAEGGKARCCQCVPHDGCEDSPTPTDESFEDKVMGSILDYNDHMTLEAIVADILAAHNADKERAVREALDQISAERETAARKERTRILLALVGMYEQYCPGRLGHYFMGAGETAIEVIEDYGLGNEIDGIDDDAVAALRQPTGEDLR